MKVFVLLALVAVASAIEITPVEHRNLDVQWENGKEKFEHFKTRFQKNYKNAQEELTALESFLENDAFILEHNAKGASFTVGHNEFSDMTWDSFKAQYVGGSMNKPVHERNDIVDHRVGGPSSIDWVSKGAVTPVKNQGQCGSCWAFSTTGSLEGAFEIATGNLVSLSEQDLVSCDHNGDQGCNGGLMDNAFGWVKQNGICKEGDYPYQGVTGTCQKTCKPVMTITGHKDVPKGDETTLKNFIGQQPVSVAIEADKSAFQFYKSGVFDNSGCGRQLDHGVLAVGYGTMGGKDYYKVKNSWGASWGMNGYILMVQGKDMCGIADSASIPTGAKAYGSSKVETVVSVNAGTHYGDPLDGACQSDEVNVTVTGVSGPFCSPLCTGTANTCPTDKPTGVTANPQCALQSTAGKKYCALICSPSLPIADQNAADAQCGSKASCKPISGVGLCTYDA